MKNNYPYKIFIIKFGDTVEEFKRYVQKDVKGENIYAPTLDYIPQLYQKLKGIKKDYFVYWIGVGGYKKEILEYENNLFITLKSYPLFYLYYWLFKSKPDLIVNISSQYSVLPLLSYKIINKNVKILHFLAGEFKKNIFRFYIIIY